ncbi:MAG: hypothetical protein R6V45_03150 [Oceanipulchritudo sp.]
MNKNKITELKELEKLANKIAKKKARLEAQVEAEKETAKWYDQVLKESEFKRPRDLIKALMEHFGIRSVNLSGSKRGPGRPPKAESEAKPQKETNGTRRRKRTKVTPEVRDEVKASLTGGMSKNAAAKNFGISYPVVRKIEDGVYDNL